jgi:16S rRNA (cytosine967-C5)-methyltransferase
VVLGFLARERTAGVCDPDVPWGEVVDCGRQLLPTPGGTDGLFYALLNKVA